MLFVDVDHFESVNDAFGHQMGDEEFLLLLRHVDREQAVPNGTAPP